MQTTGSTIKTKWSIDRVHSYIGFRAKHLMFTNVRGNFNEFDATVYTSGDDFTNAEINCWLSPASISTGDEKRDTHLKSNDFLDVENFKEIRFTGKSFVDVDKSGNYELIGDLTIRGVKKKITLHAEFGGIVNDPWGNKKALFTVSGKSIAKTGV